MTRYDFDADGLERWLGPLEAALMDYLWDCTSPRTLAQVHYYRGGGRTSSTIQTTLHRLVRKGLLRRVEAPHADYQYTPVEPRETWEARQIEIVRESLGI